MAPLKYTSAIVSANTGSRLRIGGAIAAGAGLASKAEPIPCLGFLRSAGEIVCAPDIDGDGHPFSSILSRLPAEEAWGESPIRLSDLPNSVGLVLPERILRFNAQWSKNQVDLQIGPDALRWLGREEGQESRVRVITWGGLLVLMSYARYEAALSQPLTTTA